MKEIILSGKLCGIFEAKTKTLKIKNGARSWLIQILDEGLLIKFNYKNKIGEDFIPFKK